MLNVTSTETIVLELVRAQEAADPYAFRLAPQEYLLRREGGGFAAARLDWDEALLHDLAAARLPGRDRVVLQRLGELLRRFLLPLGWAEHEARIQAAREGNRRVHVSLRFAAAELYALPWELLTFRATGQHLGELPNVLLRYEWPSTASTPEGPEAARGESGRILFAWSAAAGAVPATEQLRAIAAGSRIGSLPFDKEADVIPHVSTSRLSAALQAAQRDGRPVAVLHLLCHGAAAGTTFGLAFDEPESGGAAVVVDAGRLRQLLAPFSATLRLVVLCACDSGNSGALGNQLGSVAQALHRVGIAAVVASRFPLSVAGAIRLTETLYQELLGGPQALETALLAARRRLAEQATSLDWASVQLYARSEDGADTRPLSFRPFRGLLAFHAEHRRFFFSREREIAEVVSDLRALDAGGRPRFLIIAGASGSGKSSLLWAGAVPQLTAQNDPPLPIMRLRPGNQEELESLLRQQRHAPSPILIVVDQLEELFTHVADSAARQEWVQKLFRLSSEKGSGVSVLLTLRVDFIGRCGEILLAADGQRLDSVAYDEAHRVFVAQLSPEQLSLVIEEPARKVGLILEDGLAQRLLRDVDAEPGALPVLEYTLDLLWEKRLGRVLTQASYDAVGGVAGALQGRAEALISSMSAEEQNMARRLLVRLCAVGDDPAQSTRRRVRTAELRPDGEEGTRFDAVLSALVTARLLVGGGEDVHKTVEIAHEALIRKWPRLLDWVRADRKKLFDLEKLEQWTKQRIELGTLLSGAQLLRAEEIYSQHEKECSPAVQTLIRDSQAAERRARRRRQAGIAGLCAATLVFAFLAWFGFRQSTAANLARQKESAARARAVAAQQQESVAQKDTQRRLLNSYVERGREYLVERKDPVRAILWLYRAYQGGLDTAALRMLLSQAYFRLGEVRPLLDGKNPKWSPDGSLLITEQKGQIKLWEARSSRLVQSFPGSSASFNSDGTRVVVVRDEGHSAAIVELKSAQTLVTLRAPEMTIQGPSFSPDGTRVASCKSDASSIAVWNADDGQLLRTIPAPRPPLKFAYSQFRDQRVHFSRDGLRLLTDGQGPTGAWNARTGKRLWDTTRSPHPGITFAQLSIPSDRIFLTWQNMLECKDVIEIWDAKNGKRLSEQGTGVCADTGTLSSDGKYMALQAHLEEPVLYDWALPIKRRLPSSYYAGDSYSPTLLFNADGTVLLTQDEDSIGMLWENKSGELLQTIAIMGTPAAFSPDGQMLAVVEGNENSRILDIGLFDTMPGLRGARWVAEGAIKKSWNRRQSPDKKRELDVNDSDFAVIQEAGTHKPLQRLDAHVHMSFTRDGAYVLTWYSEEQAADKKKDGFIVVRARIWDTATGALLIEQHGETAARLADSVDESDSSVRTADGKPWELSVSLPEKAALDRTLRCRVPLRIEGESLVQRSAEKDCR